MNHYRTSPLDTTSIPKGIPYIIGNEAAERFSFYGMRAILVVFMTQYLLTTNGQPDHMSADEAKGFVPSFCFCCLFHADAWRFNIGWNSRQI